MKTNYSIVLSKRRRKADWKLPDSKLRTWFLQHIYISFSCHWLLFLLYILADFVLITLQLYLVTSENCVKHKSNPVTAEWWQQNPEHRHKIELRIQSQFGEGLEVKEKQSWRGRSCLLFMSIHEEEEDNGHGALLHKQQTKK